MVNVINVIKNSRAVSDDTYKAEEVEKLCEIQTKTSAKVDKNLATNVMRHRGKALEESSKTGCAAVSRNPEQLYRLFQLYPSFHRTGIEYF